MKDLSLHILDIVQNSIRAKATVIGIEIDEQPDENQLIITITDNGTGMDPQQLKRAIDPFYTSRTARKVGLGLSLFKQNTEMTGGNFTYPD
jgi:signal transduction histidine kinase